MTVSDRPGDCQRTTPTGRGQSDATSITIRAPGYAKSSSPASGELSALPHKVPGLPLDFADRFFLSEARDRDDEGGEDEDPVEAARTLVEARKEDLAEAEAHLKKVEAEREAAAAAAAAIAEEKAKIAAIEAEVAEKSKLASALKAKLSKLTLGA
jgi:hypothetical protein